MSVVLLGVLLLGSLSACSTETVAQQDQDMNDMPFQASPTDTPDEIGVDQDTDQIDDVEDVGDRRNN